MGSRGRPPPGIERGPCRGLAELNIGNGNAGILPLSASAAQACLAEVRFGRDVARLHRLGLRPLYELLAELGRDHLIRTAIETKVARYTDRLTPELLAVANGNRLPPAPLWRVGGEQ